MGIVELVDKVAADLDVTKVAARKMVDTVLAGIQDLTDDGDKLSIRGFGTFANKTSKAREGRNPATGDVIQIPAKTKLTFKAAK